MKYVFLDVVGFTRNRSVEAQADVVAALNRIVRTTCERNRIDPLYLPTGDGMCICVLDVNARFDIHVRIALGVLHRIAGHNRSTRDPSRRFEVRIGVSENEDNVVTDINGATNVAGNGINMASRVMDLADGGQLMSTEIVHELLCHREGYLNAFRSFTTPIKHGVQIRVNQFIGGDSQAFQGLNRGIPSAFDAEHNRLTQLQAHFIAHGLRHRDEFQSLDNVRQDDALVAFLWFLANASVKDAAARGESPERPLEYYLMLDSELLREFTALIRNSFQTLSHCFESTHPGRPLLHFPNRRGRMQLVSEFPEVARQFSLVRR